MTLYHAGGPHLISRGLNRKDQGALTGRSSASRTPLASRLGHQLLHVRLHRRAYRTHAHGLPAPAPPLVPLLLADFPGYMLTFFSLNVLNRLFHFLLVQSIAVEKSDDNLSFYSMPKELFLFL